MERLKLPPIDYYQIKINYNTVETAQVSNIDEYLRSYQLPHIDSSIIYTQGFDQSNTASECAERYGMTEITNFRLWLDLIVKESLGLLSINTLIKYEAELKLLFDKISIRHGENLVYTTDIDQRKVRSDIRNSFAVRRRFNTKEELVPEEASLLKVNALKSPIEDNITAIYAPSQAKVAEIMSQDSKPVETISEEIRKYLIEHGLPLPDVEKSVNDRAYHYLPYHLDSKLEEDYLYSVINHIKSVPDVEFYFNGDDTLTDFRNRCYTKRGRAWKLDGYYYPDFLMLTRNSDNTINKIIIIETKGEGFAGKFVPRRQFIDESFIKLNNETIGYPRFEFLYIEDTLTKEERLQKTINKINSFLLNR